MPVATDKVEGPSTSLTFLGIEIDSQLQELRLPTPKLQELLLELSRWQDRRKATKRQLLAITIIGKLAFAAKVVSAGRLFTRDLITLSTSKKRLHLHIDLSSRAHADIRWWQKFLPSWNGRSIFLEEAWTDTADLNLYTDAQAPKGSVHILTVNGFEVTGFHHNSSHFAPFNGKNSLSSWQQQ